MTNEATMSENPYWHSQGQPHPVNLQRMRECCFDIYNIFAASGELAGQFEFGEDDHPEFSSLMQLHHEMAESRALELLLQLAILVRTYDDILLQSDISEIYTRHAKDTLGDNYIGTLDTGAFGLREACNKIIHAEEVRPIYDSVERDDLEGGDPVRVWHLSGEIELAGKLNKKTWEAVLYVRPFLEIVLDRISFGWGPDRGASDNTGSDSQQR